MANNITKIKIRTGATVTGGETTDAFLEDVAVAMPSATVVKELDTTPGTVTLKDVAGAGVATKTEVAKILSGEYSVEQ